MVIIEKIPGLFASIYEKATRIVIGTYYACVAEEVVSHLKEGTILDLGTGPGYLPIQIVKNSLSIKVHGIDLGHKLIKMAKRNARKAGVSDRVRFETGNAAALRVKDDSYDMVISTGMLHMLRDPVAVLKECYRVLKPGREAWIYDPAQVSSHIDKKKYRASLTFQEKIVFKLFVLYAKLNQPHTYNKKQVSEMLSTTDFRKYWIDDKDKELRIKLKK